MQMSGVSDGAVIGLLQVNEKLLSLVMHISEYLPRWVQIDTLAIVEVVPRQSEVILDDLCLKHLIRRLMH